MRRIDEALKEIDYLIDHAILEDFIARGWVRPVRDEIDYVFDDMDMARIRLICDLHIDMKFEIDAVDLILSLMDKLYKSRLEFKKLTEAIEKQPDNVYNEIIDALGENGN